VAWHADLDCKILSHTGRCGSTLRVGGGADFPTIRVAAPARKLRGAVKESVVAAVCDRRYVGRRPPLPSSHSFRPQEGYFPLWALWQELQAPVTVLRDSLALAASLFSRATNMAALASRKLLVASAQTASGQRPSSISR